MQLLLSMVLLISFATFQLTYGDESQVEAEDITELQKIENDDELDDSGAKYRWLAPLLYDELEERGQRLQKRSVNPTGGPVEEEQEEKKKKKNKNKGKGKGKDKKKNKKDKKKGKNKDITEEEKKLWFSPLGCYRDKGVKAWKDPSIRSIFTLYKNNRKKINWEWGHFLQVIMACAEGAHARGYACFGIQFYGECWGAENACETYERYGNSTKCTKDPEKGLVGLHWANFVYQGRCGSVYGCCPDGAMPAQGPNYEGCPDCTTAVDLVFVIDSSGSIGRKNFELIKKCIVSLTRHFSVSESNARIGVVRYATTAQIVTSLHKSQKMGFLKIAKKVEKMRYTKGGTKTGRGLSLANKMLRSSKRRLDGKVLKHDQVVIVLTDGLTNVDDVARFNTFSAALRDVAHVVAVGVEGKGYGAELQQQQKTELSQMASTDDALFYEASFEKLRDHLDPIAKQACPLVYKKKGRK